MVLGLVNNLFRNEGTFQQLGTFQLGIASTVKILFLVVFSFAARRLFFLLLRPAVTKMEASLGRNL